MKIYDNIVCTSKKSGYESNKDVKFKKIDSIYIEKFRTIEDRTIILGENITLISGKMVQ